MDPSNQPATATALMGASVVWCLLVGVVVVVVSSRRLLCSVCCAEKIRRSDSEFVVSGFAFPPYLSYF